ncbi:hypothetical protein C2S53_013417 [Perilla frutescens var. hirtella]|uniref:Uncharacterized protein n=1 Tax=Perilla frutescens var. hirtella TaxID=608512 RepID=A0AAD4P5T4_PERFH|nr:hypothetical protein C2S53_013417 [Perilla frutescens var. hirtella]
MDGAVGFDDDVIAMKSKLCGESSELQVIPVVGMGGIASMKLSDDEISRLKNELIEQKVFKSLKNRSNAVWRKNSFAFPTMLKKLTFSGLQLAWDEMTVVGSLPNLRVLKLRDFSCIGSKWETTEGEFPQLEFLLIEQSDLQHWETESSHFPSLKCLMFRYCWYLRNIPYDIGEIPTLELIEVKKCHEDLVESAKEILEEQRSCGNEALQFIVVKQWLMALIHTIGEVAVTMLYFTSFSEHIKFLLCYISEVSLNISNFAIGEILTLELIEVLGDEEEPVIKSVRRIQVEQEDLGNDALQVRCTPCRS